MVGDGKCLRANQAERSKDRMSSKDRLSAEGKRGEITDTLLNY